MLLLGFKGLTGRELFIPKGFSIAMKGLNGGRLSVGEQQNGCSSLLLTLPPMPLPPPRAPPTFTASCSLGAAWAAIEHTTSYMKERKAFGQPLANFQVITTTITPHHMIMIISTTPSPYHHYTITISPLHHRHITTTPSPYHHYHHHITTTPSPYHHYTIAISPLHHHHITTTPSPYHHYTITISPLPSPHHHYTITISPLHHHHITTTPSPYHHYTITISPLPSPHHHYTIAISPLHHHHITTTPSPHHHYTIAISPLHHHHITTTPSPIIHMLLLLLFRPHDNLAPPTSHSVAPPPSCDSSLSPPVPAVQDGRHGHGPGGLTPDGTQGSLLPPGGGAQRCPPVRHGQGLCH